MRHGSLFSGIGGFDLAAAWLGWSNIFQVEIDETARRVLAYHFPDTDLHNDIVDFNASEYTGRVDIISGGFPCQPFSYAGQRKGESDERYLWGEMYRVIREIEPSWVVAENVPGLLTISGGLAMERVYTDLEDTGYETQSYIIPASGVGAPHQRNRVWIVAHKPQGGATTYPDEPSKRRNGGANQREAKEIRRGAEGDVSSKPSFQEDVTNPGSERCNRGESGEQAKRGYESNEQLSKGCDQFPMPNFEMFPTKPPLCGGDDGLPKRLDGIPIQKWRKEALKGYGNAIVPQIAYQIFKSIEYAESMQP